MTMATATKATEIQGTFTSVWAEGEITTPATLNLEDGSLCIVTSEDGDEFEHLESEKFEAENGDEYTVCPECHEYILKTVMVPGVGKTLVETQECSNPDCGHYAGASYV
jgi:hypothetical protein